LTDRRFNQLSYVSPSRRATGKINPCYNKRMVRIKVKTYSGYKADERPTSFVIGTRVFQVTACLDRWYGEGYDYFKLRADDGYTYIIGHDRSLGQWELVKMEKDG